VAKKTKKATKKKATRRRAPKQKSRSVTPSEVDGARLELMEARRADALDLVTNPERKDQRAALRTACARLGIGGDVLRVPKARPAKRPLHKMFTKDRMGSMRKIFMNER